MICSLRKLLGRKSILDKPRKKTGFTLIEILIVLAILGILFTVIFQAYSKTSEITLKVESEKKIMAEIITLHQFLDNISDQYHINYAAYTGANSIDINENGFTKTLALIKNDSEENATIERIGECDDDIKYETLSGGLVNKSCRLQLQNNQNIQLTDPEKIYLANIVFKIYPSTGYSGDIFTQLALDKIESEGFGIFGHIYNKNFSKNLWSLQNHIPLQAFFNINK